MYKEMLPGFDIICVCLFVIYMHVIKNTVSNDNIYH